MLMRTRAGPALGDGESAVRIERHAPSHAVFRVRGIRRGLRAGTLFCAIFILQITSEIFGQSHFPRCGIGVVSDAILLFIRVLRNLFIISVVVIRSPTQTSAKIFWPSQSRLMFARQRHQSHLALPASPVMMWSISGCWTRSP